MKFEKLGWVVAAALAGAFVATGFQGTTTKIGTVDIKQVFDKSDYAAAQTGVLRNLGQSRASVLAFMNQYRAMKADDAKKFRDLSLKANPSQGDKDALEQLKTAVATDDAKYHALQTKTPLSADEQTQLADYQKRVQATGALQAQWATEFDTEVGDLQAKLRDQALGKVKESIGQVARTQGYSIVFDAAIAPYSANDITDESLTAMNKKK